MTNRSAKRVRVAKRVDKKPAPKRVAKPRAAPPVKSAPKKAAPKRAAKSAPKSAAQPTSVAAAVWPRDEALEQAIIDAPLDPVPRMVYADWLQGAGDRRGEWMALHSAIERDPTNVRMRSLAVDFLGENAALLLGPGKTLLPGAWVGWRSGFIDELRVQAMFKHKGTVAALAGLLAHPSCRFVRCVGLGALGQEGVDALVAAAPPLLETVVANDVSYSNTDVDLDGIAALPTVRRLGLYGAQITKPMPQLVELSCRMGIQTKWLADGGCENVERLTIHCNGAPGDTVRDLLRRVPRVRQLRLLQTIGVTELLDAVLAMTQLDLLDLSHSRLTDADVERLVGWRGLRLIAIRNQLSDAMIARLEKEGATVVASTGGGRIDDDHGGPGWLHHRLAADGRDGLATMPGIGLALFNVGTQHSIHGKAEDATPLLDASLTFPNQELKTWAWANAAIAHERRREFDEAELIAREGLLRVPKEPNLFAIVVDVLRRTNRLREAEAMVPRALASIEAAPGLGAHQGGRAACLADIMFVLAQAGRHDEVLELAKTYPELVDQRRDMFAIMAMSQVALGNIADARASLAKANGSRFPAVLAHAQAVVGLVAKRPDLGRAVRLLQTAKDEPYPEWHWIANDPNLAKLAEHAGFKVLLET